MTKDLFDLPPDEAEQTVAEGFQPETAEPGKQQVQAERSEPSANSKFLQVLLHQMPLKLQQALNELLFPGLRDGRGGRGAVKRLRKGAKNAEQLSGLSLLASLEAESIAGLGYDNPGGNWIKQEPWRLQWLQTCAAQAQSGLDSCWSMIKDFGLSNYVEYRYFEDCYRYSRSCLEREQQGEFRILLQGQEGYPQALQALRRVPRLLFWQGELLPQDAEATAIVGTRQADSWGQHQAWQEAVLLQKQLPEDWPSTEGTSFCLELSPNACPHWVISGLAQGCDYAAHKGALDAAAPTLAVLPGGFDCIYPKNHSSLARRIVTEGGALASEYVPQAAPLKWRFIQRDRLQSALARRVLLVQSAIDGGSMHAVLAALELGKDVYVLEGSEPCWQLDVQDSAAAERRSGSLTAKCRLQPSPRNFGTVGQRGQLMTVNQVLFQQGLARLWGSYRRED